MQPYTSGLDTIFNGRGCYTYALKDVNPDDSSKRVLEKPKVNAGNILSKLEFISKIL